MKKIVITGGLGYIGMELCKIYSGEARFKDIVVIDNKFWADRVRQLNDWNIKYVQCSLLDLDSIKEVINDADVVYHLAGVTDVAYTKTQSDEHKDREILEFGVTGTRILLNLLPKKCKLLFPSTHVVYEGLKKSILEIDELYPVSPILTYSNGKVQSENDIKQSDLDYIIVRLGSVYGLSGDSMRINIMPNLFSKITSLSGEIKLFSGGNQYKSLVNVIDVCRAMKFLIESEYSRETFHLSNENLTIKDVASICKKINPSVNIIETDDEIPNNGYTLSNKKLLSTGFKFLYDIESSIKEMVHAWKPRNRSAVLEYKLKGTKDFIDDRGKISNYELTEPINLIGWIESKAGSVRANHYHPIQEQKCLLISGKYISVIKDLARPDSELETRIINPGDIAIIKPNVAHAMVFLEDSIFLNLVRGEREHENYGITHTIPYVLVDERTRIMLLNGYKFLCRSCKNTDLKDIVSLGMQPLANNLEVCSDAESDRYPLEIKFCDNCKNVQLSYVVPANKMFDNYLYVSSTAASFRKHFSELSLELYSYYKLNSNSVVVDIGSNDGVFLLPMQELGVKTIGVEPAKNLAELASNKGIKTINNYFNDDVIECIMRDYSRVDIVTAFNVFAHADDLVGIANNVFKILKEEGTFVVEVQYFFETLRNMIFDNIYHEHVNYWTLTSLKNFFDRLGFIITRAEQVNTHGGSLRIHVKRQGVSEQSVFDILKSELDFGIEKYDTYTDFANRLKKLQSNVRKNIKLLKKKYKNIVAYGSPAKATTSLNYFGIDKNYINYTVEDNILKVGKYIPGVSIPIVDKKDIEHTLPDLVLVLAWNFFEEIKINNKELIEKGIKFMSIKELEKKILQ